MLLCLLFSIAACKKGKEYITDSGFKYRLYTESKGKKPQIGDYVIIEMVYRTMDDSILYDSRVNKTPMRFKLEHIPFQGSYEEGLTYLSEGDSATFYVPADSLYAYYTKNTYGKTPQEETVFKTKTFLLFDIKLIEVQDYVVAEQDQMIKKREAQKEEKKTLFKFIYGKDFSASPDSGQYFIKKVKQGNGSAVSKGKLVSVQYTGKFLNGEVFDYFGSPGKPFTFKAGAGQVIKGWEAAILGLHEGDRVELLIPSNYAYGEEGLLDATSGSFIIPPFTTLWYDMEVVQITDSIN
jgi:FKBP-type peptidyl-prolyl cis-trans isomerase